MKTETQKQPHSDQKYVIALLNNDTVVINEIYKRFATVIERMVLQNKGTVSDAADIFQDALISIYQTAKKREFVLKNGFEAYLKSVCINKWRDILGREKKYKKVYSLLNEYESDPFKEVEEFALQQQLLVLVKEKILKLGKLSQEVLLLWSKGKKMKEVALLLKITPESTRKYKCESLKRLKASIMQSPDFPL